MAGPSAVWGNDDNLLDSAGNALGGVRSQAEAIDVCVRL